jgi:hypothetical protein
MKKQLFIGLALLISIMGRGQTSFVSDFENLGLSAGQVYNGSSGGGGFQGSHAFFPTVWDTAWGGFWAGGWAASAVYDSSTAGFTNLYGCIAHKGYGNSNTFAVASAYNGLNIRMTDSLIGKTVSGFYVCNATYSYKSMKYGDGFARAFGDTTGTGCGCAQGSYPDWFKLTIRKYFAGALQNDSVEVYLADYRFANSAQDYILKNWTWINLSSLGSADSLLFSLRSSDNGTFGMNTPAYFCLDNFTMLNAVGIDEQGSLASFGLVPNPATEEMEVIFSSTGEFLTVAISDAMGSAIAVQPMQPQPGANRVRFSIADLAPGVYYVTLKGGRELVTKKLIRQ